MRLMSTTVLAALSALSLTLATGAFAAPPTGIETALADKGRPAEDVARDAARKPADMVAFAGIKPGDTVIDFIPGGGYFTRVFSGVVGPKGHVYAMVPQVAAAYQATLTATIETFAKDHPNTSVVIVPLGSLSADKPADVFWTAQNYHDLHIPFAPDAKPIDMVGYNKLVWAALKPGGLYVIVDHVAKAGATDADVKALHRIDPAVIIKEVEAAGFKLEGRSDALANPADPHTANVFDLSIKGKTDQVTLKFRKVG